MSSERKKILMHRDPFCDHFLVSKVTIIDATDEFANFGHVLSIANVQNRSAKSRARDHLEIGPEMVKRAVGNAIMNRRIISYSSVKRQILILIRAKGRYGTVRFTACSRTMRN